MKKILTSYRYMFYREYCWNKRLFGEKDFPQYNTLFGMSTSLFLIFISFGFLLGIHEYILDLPTIVGKTIYFLAAALILLLHYVLFIRNKEYLKILQEFKDKPDPNRIINGYLVVLYAIGPLILLIATSFLLPEQNNST